MKAIYVKAKAGCEPVAFINNIDSRYVKRHQSLRTDDFDKDVEAKKPSLYSPANYTS